MDLEGSAHSAACVTDSPRIAGETCLRKFARYEVPTLSSRSPLTETPQTVCDSKPEPFIKFWRRSWGYRPGFFVVFHPLPYVVHVGTSYNSCD